MEDAVRETTKTRAPWYVFRQTINGFATSPCRAFVETLDEMNIQIPKPYVDLRAIRLQYHSAKIEQEESDRLSRRPSKQLTALRKRAVGGARKRPSAGT